MFEIRMFILFKLIVFVFIGKASVCERIKKKHDLGELTKFKHII